LSDVRTISEIRKIGIKALAQSLGPIGMVRFLQSFELGYGDYTKERHEWLEEDIDKIVSEIKKEEKLMAIKVLDWVGEK